MKTHPEFGDRIRNLYASEDNPIRDGYYVNAIRRTGRLNKGVWYRITDGRGRFWEMPRGSAILLDEPTDTDLLNWMIAHGAYLSHSRDGDVCNVWLSQDPEDDSNGAVPAEGYPQKCYIDAREAIRAAMHRKP